MDKMEVWREIVDYSSYEVSNFGNVRSWRSKNGVGLSEAPHLLKKTPFSGRKYLRVVVRNEHGKKTARVHRLVLEAFIGRCPANHQCCHKDDNQANNHLDNLYWGTVQQNADDRSKNGKQVRGEKVSLSKITEKKAKEVKSLLSKITGYGSMKKIAEMTGVPYKIVAAIKYNKSWSYV